MSSPWLVDLDLVSYDDALDLQRRLVAAKKAGGVEQDVLFLLEHPPVITLGSRGGHENIRVSEERLRALGIPVYPVERGGNVTYHGPGQLVGYPVLSLKHYRKDVRWFVGAMQATLLRTLADYRIAAYALGGEQAGLWVRDTGAVQAGRGGCGPDGPHTERKIMAQGIRITRWVTFHGFALNVNTNLAHFDLIVPCGLEDRGVTSMERELGTAVPMEEVKARVAAHFQQVFERPLAPRTRADVEALLAQAPATPLPAGA